MDRDDANREVVRVLEHYRNMRHDELDAAVELGPVETELMSHGEWITISVNVVRCLSDAYRIDVSAFGNNWWKHERIDESLIINFGKS